MIASTGFSNAPTLPTVGYYAANNATNNGTSDWSHFTSSYYFNTLSDEEVRRRHRAYLAEFVWPTTRHARLGMTPVRPDLRPPHGRAVFKPACVTDRVPRHPALPSTRAHRRAVRRLLA